MRVMIFEWLCGGGLWRDNHDFDENCPVLQQGWRMLLAVTEDFSTAGHEVTILLDQRVTQRIRHASSVVSISSPESLTRKLQTASDQAEAILVIAPETDSCLLNALTELNHFTSKIVNPDCRFVALTSNKSSTAEYLHARAVPVPIGCRFPDLGTMPDLSFPCVVKPNFGAGSENVRYIKTVEQFEWPQQPTQYRVERFVAGKPVSVSAIASKSGVTILPPTGQVFDTSPIGHYVGSEYPLPPKTEKRATRLAQRCVKALPSTRGYFGIDIVIADAGARHDCVIEVNPRLTCSYMHLRKMVDQNLAELMLKSLA